MEHHSNQTSWLETIADVEIIQPTKDGRVDIENFKHLLEKYQHRKTKIAAITSCSNVTGVSTPYHEIAEIIHQQGGKCFVDFACSAPYVDIDMHPDNSEQYLDAIYFSPHKFLGGPSSSGILIFNHSLYKNTVPDSPGGGTVEWTNPWGRHQYVQDVETREDGGTPAFLQTIRIALAIQLKDQMGVSNIQAREEQLIDLVWSKLTAEKNIHILADNIKDRLGVISFYLDDLHYNLATILLNDLFGIQVRGGCSCAGTYGHYLMNITEEESDRITCSIDSGECSVKPGWVRLSLHPTLTNDECEFIADSIVTLAKHHKELLKEKDYSEWNESSQDNVSKETISLVDTWFNLESLVG